MKVLILAGGLGSRLSEETILKPKPMVEIGGKPILWHIMKIYSQYGFNDFIILCGYKGYMIKEYFANYYRHMSDLTVDLQNNSMVFHKNHAEPWKITMVDTGVDTMTGGRIRHVKKYVENETFMLTYGDGLADINLDELIQTHRKSGKIVTMTSVQPAGRFGSLKLNELNEITEFKEKPRGDGGWINGGFFVCEPAVFEFIQDAQTIFEREPLENLAEEGQLMAYRHMGFWKSMDTLRDKIRLEELLAQNLSPWLKEE